MLSLGGKEFAWNSAWTYALAAAAAVLLALAVWQERRAREPIMPPHLFANHTFVITSLAGFVVGVAMFGAIVILFLVPWLDTSKVRSSRFRPIYKQFFWILVLDCFVLGWVGANAPEGHFILIGRLATAYYFLHFLVILPIVSSIEKPKPLPYSITEAVLGSDKKAVLGENTQPAV